MQLVVGNIEDMRTDAIVTAVHPEMKIVLVLYTQGIYRLAGRIFQRVSGEPMAR